MNHSSTFNAFADWCIDARELPETPENNSHSEGVSTHQVSSHKTPKTPKAVVIIPRSLFSPSPAVVLRRLRTRRSRIFGRSWCSWNFGRWLLTRWHGWFPDINNHLALASTMFTIFFGAHWTQVTALLDSSKAREDEKVPAGYQWFCDDLLYRTKVTHDLIDSEETESTLFSSEKSQRLWCHSEVTTHYWFMHGPHSSHSLPLLRLLCLAPPCHKILEVEPTPGSTFLSLTSLTPHPSPRLRVPIPSFFFFSVHSKLSSPLTIPSSI